MGVDGTARKGSADLLTALRTPLQGLAVVVLAAWGVFLLAGAGWCLITVAGLLLLDLLTELIPERSTSGRTDGPSGT